MMEYKRFLEKKAINYGSSGFKVLSEDLNNKLFDWQRELVRWALYKGRSALFEDCGLGKTAQQLEWGKHISSHTGGDVLILAPLAVSLQTKREGVKFGIEVNVCRSQDDVIGGINITNYENLDNFDPAHFTGIVLDESSILKNFTGKYCNKIIESFINTPYKLACTATPSPNDYTELGTTAEFLGVMTRPEMLSMFFINDAGDTGTWRLKGHVKDNLFWEWLSSWAVMIRKPSDIGYDDNGFVLPPLIIHEHVVPFNGCRETLFVEPARTLSDRRKARSECLDERVSIASNMANQSEEKWVMWCNMNAESSALKASINGAVEVTGSDNQDYKEISLLSFSKGEIKVLVTKPRIAGFGMNFQNCSNMAFVGLSDSYEQFYQAVRRCWRFGQPNPVHAHIITGEREGNVVDNIKRKEADASAMFDGMVSHMATFIKKELSGFKQNKTDYTPKIEMKLPAFMEESQ